MPMLEQIMLTPEKSIEDAYKLCCEVQSDINEHLPTLLSMALGCPHITEFGTRLCLSTIAFLNAKPDKLVCYDLWESDQCKELQKRCPNMEFHRKSVLEVEIEQTDLLFIDTWHVYEQLKRELELHSGKVSRYIVLHDTEICGLVGESPGHKGLRPAVDEFLLKGTFQIEEDKKNNNGLMILRRIAPEPEAEEKPSVKGAQVYLTLPFYQSFIGQVLQGYDQGVAPGSPNSYVKFPMGGPFHVKNFNDAWCEAMNGRGLGWTHLAMIHHDVTPYGFWLDQMVELMRKHNADVLAVVLPIKDIDGYTSTALRDRKTGAVRRITMHELWGLPVGTFSKLNFPGRDLLISSGLWIADFTKPWVEKVWFDCRSKIMKRPDGMFVTQTVSEDWFFSHLLNELDLRVFATREVCCDHWGQIAFTNSQAWGTKKSDEQNAGSFGEWFEWPKPEDAPMIPENDPQNNPEYNGQMRS